MPGADGVWFNNSVLLGCEILDNLQRFYFVFGLLLLFCNSGFANQDINQQLSECKSLEDDHAQKALALAEVQLAQLSKQDNALLYGGFLSCAAWAAVGLNQTELALTYASDLEVLIRNVDGAETKVN